MKLNHPVVASLRTACCIATATLCALTSSHALAQTTEAEISTIQTPPLPFQGNEAWDITVGAGVGAVPAYPGAKRFRATVLPLVSISYRDLAFLNSDGIGLNVINTHGFKAGPLLSYDADREEKWDRRLRGMGDIEPSLTGGGFLSYTYGPFQITAIAKQALTHASYGLSGSLRGDYQGQITQNLAFQVGPDLDYGNAKYERTWFGVSNKQSARSSLPTYRAHAGIQDVGFHTNFVYHLSPNIEIQSVAAVKELVSGAAHSPLVQHKSEMMAGLGLAYHF